MNKDQIKGRINEAEGKSKEVTGNIVGNKRLEEKGKGQKNIGKIQKGLGNITNDLKNGN